MMEGDIVQLPTGEWAVRVYAGQHARVIATFQSMSLAIEYCEEVSAAQEELANTILSGHRLN